MSKRLPVVDADAGDDNDDDDSYQMSPDSPDIEDPGATVSPVSMMQDSSEHAKTDQLMNLTRHPIRIQPHNALIDKPLSWHELRP